MGVILYEMLCGEKPFRSFDPKKDSLWAYAEERAATSCIPLQKRTTGIPSRLVKIVIRCLDPDETKRYGSAVDLLSDLQAAEAAMSKRRADKEESLASFISLINIKNAFSGNNTIVLECARPLPLLHTLSFTNFYSMTRIPLLLIGLLLGTPLLSRADSIHDTLYYSRQLERDARYMVILPSDFREKGKRGRRFPVLYLLHCAGCDHRSFVECYHIEGLIDTFEMIVAIPYDGTGAGWWLDSPINPLSQLSKWLTGEFKHRIDSLYPTFGDRSNTGVAGHSMGGFGALHNLVKHSDVFGAAFSAKGKIDLIENGGGYFTDAVLGDFAKFIQHYRAVDILSNADEFVGINAAIKFYTGPNDRFQIENRAFSRRLTKLGVRHEYFENAEDHYCMSRESMRILLAFFNDYFQRRRTAP